MDERPFAKPAPNGSVPQTDVKAAKVLLAGTMETGGNAAACTVRSLAPGQAALRTSAALEAGDAVHVRLTGDRQLWGEVESCEDGFVSLQLSHAHEWVDQLCGCPTVA